MEPKRLHNRASVKKKFFVAQWNCRASHPHTPGRARPQKKTFLVAPPPHRSQYSTSGDGVGDKRVNTLLEEQ